MPDISRMLGRIHCADAATFISKLPDESIDFVMTSPPYWGLRDYGVEGQIGLERHPQEYIDRLVVVFHDLKRVLKPHGSFYLNLGDTYCSMKGSCFNAGGSARSIPQAAYKQLAGAANPNRMLKADGRWLQPKQLLMIPTRMAVALQEDGWILRNDIIWYKPNGLPNGVKDRLVNKYEHVFHFVKIRRYYYNLDAIRVPHMTGNPPEKNPGDVVAARGKSAGLRKIGAMRSPPDAFKPVTFHPLGTDPSNLVQVNGQLFPRGQNPACRYGSHRNKWTRWRKAEEGVNSFGCRKADKPRTINACGKNPGDIYVGDEETFEFWKAAVLDEYARIGRIGPKRFSGKHELVEEGAASFRALLNSGRARNAVYAIIEGSPVSDELKQRLKNWWHDHGGHWLGRNPGDFWEISTRPFPEAHFAVYPEELCVRPILSSCPALVCKACGKTPTPVVRRPACGNVGDWRSRVKERGMPVARAVAHRAGDHAGLPGRSRERQAAGCRSCGCHAPFQSGIVFDPFAGAGTTLVMAKKLGRRWLGCDLNPKYLQIARRRLKQTTA